MGEVPIVILLFLVYIKSIFTLLCMRGNIEDFILSLFLIVRGFRHPELLLSLTVVEIKCSEFRPAVLETKSVQSNAPYLYP